MIPSTVMSRWVVLSLLFGAVASAGCAFGDLTLAPPQRASGVPASQRGANRSIVVVSPFADRRPVDRCGMKKNAYNVDTANVFCREAPESSIPRLLARELQEAGFRVVRDPEDAAPGTPIVRGVVEQFFIEMNSNFFTGAMEADVAIQLRVELPHQRVAIRRFFVKGDEGTFLSPDDDMYLAQNSAVREILLDAVGALANLMDRLPPPPAVPPTPAVPADDSQEPPT